MAVFLFPPSLEFICPWGQMVLVQSSSVQPAHTEGERVLVRAIVAGWMLSLHF